MVSLAVQFQRLSPIRKLLVLAVVAVVGWWLYNTFVLKKRSGGRCQGNREGMASGDKVVCTLYYTEWCPHCKSVKPEWAKLKDMFHGKQVNGKTIVVEQVDCDKEKALADAAGVKGFPTIKFIVGGEARDYTGDRTLSGFQQYLNAL